MVEERIELADFLLIAEVVLDAPAVQVLRVTRVPEAESALAAPHASFGGTDFYPDPVERAAILCSRIVRNHPLPDGNKRVGYIAMREQLDRYEIEWTSTCSAEEVADAVLMLAARAITEADFVAWVRRQTTR